MPEYQYSFRALQAIQLAFTSTVPYKKMPNCLYFSQPKPPKLLPMQTTLRKKTKVECMLACNKSGQAKTSSGHLVDSSDKMFKGYQRFSLLASALAEIEND